MYLSDEYLFVLLCRHSFAMPSQVLYQLLVAFCMPKVEMCMDYKKCMYIILFL